MIDCHAHAYPALSERVDRALDGLSPDAGFILRDAIDDVRTAARSVAHRVGQWVPRSGPLDVERLAAAKKAVPAPVWQGLESALSVGLRPRIALMGHLDALFESMDANGIERAVLIASPPLASNDWLLKEAWPRARTRLIPVAAIPSNVGRADEATAAAAMESCVEAGAAGFQLHPERDRMRADHPAYRAAFDVCQRRSKFLILHTGCFHRRPLSGARVEAEAFEPLFRAFPRVRVCLAHATRENPAGAFELMGHYDQLFADTSWLTHDAIALGLRTVGARRLLWGSDWPMLNGNLQEQSLGTLRGAAAAKDLERMVEYSPRVFLGEA
jgi:predicted TIM-barrel fold metal-dependent hydrolase